MWYSRLLLSALAAIAVVVESGANVGQDPLDRMADARLQAVEEKAKSVDMDDASAILDIVHDKSRDVRIAARTDNIMAEARRDLYRKRRDKEEMSEFKTLASSERVDNAFKERKRAEKDAESARHTMAGAAKKKVYAEARVAKAEVRLDDAEVHIEESLAKKAARKVVMAQPLAKEHMPHETTPREIAQERRSDAEERDEEAMAFVRADKDVKGSDHYKAPGGATEKSPEEVSEERREAQAASDQKEAQGEWSTAMASAGKKVRTMIGQL